MKVLTLYSPSHIPLIDMFKKTYTGTQEVNVLTIPEQTVNNGGEFVATGWNRFMQQKIEYVLGECKEEGERIMYFDCDIVFVKPFEDTIHQYLDHYDMVFQSDDHIGGALCAGQFAFKNNVRVRNFLKDTINKTHHYRDDQVCMNNIIKHHDIKWTRLPTNQFMSYGQLHSTCWKEGINFTIPDTLITFHANWTVGVVNKLKLIDYVLKRFV